MKLWHVEFILADRHLHDIVSQLEGKAYNMKYTIMKNGKDEQPEGPKKRSNDQVKWLVAHIKDSTEARHLKEGWTKAGFRKESLYGALGRAVQQKLIKKTAAGIYKPVGG